jgi:uncharacterized membrane protein
MNINVGGSVAVLILSSFAAHMLYHLIPSTPAFILYVISIAAGIFTAVRQRSESLVVIMMIGGYLIPFLVDTDQPNVWIFVIYLASL